MILLEAKAHIDHPEDMVFINGSSGAANALDQLISIGQNKSSITLKYDGYPALIFGRGKSGQFTIVDKHMFNKRDGSGKEIYSPEQFVQYDKNRGVDRSSLYQLLYLIWDELDAMTANITGYYWGDVLFRGKQIATNGEYVFRANPHGIIYHVVEKSATGKMMRGKVAGIAVHQSLPDYAPNTEYAQSLNGSLGELSNNGNVALFSTGMTVTLTLDQKLVNVCNVAIEKFKSSVDQLYANNPYSKSTLSGLFTVYINKKIVSGDLNNMSSDFKLFVDHRKLSMDMKARYQKLFDSVQLDGIFVIWRALYNLKMSLVQQLDSNMANSDIKGYLDNGTMSHEGYVGMDIKLINRLGFSKQNLAKN